MGRLSTILLKLVSVSTSGRSWKLTALKWVCKTPLIEMQVAEIDTDRGEIKQSFQGPRTSVEGC